MKRRFKPRGKGSPYGPPPDGSLVTVRYEDWKAAFRDSVRYQMCRMSQSQYEPEAFDAVVDAKIAEAAKKLMVSDDTSSPVIQ